MTRLLLLKLARDLVAARARIVLMVVALTVSLTAFGALLYARAIVGEQIAASYMSTDPPSATILLDGGLDPARLGQVRSAVNARPGVIDSTLRTQITVQTRGTDGGTRAAPLELFVAAGDDPMTVGRYPVERGTWPPPANGVLIERDALKLMGKRVGDTVSVETPDGRTVPLRIAGVVHDPSLAPAYEEQKAYGYVSPDALPLLGRPRALDQVKVTVADTPGGTTPTHDRDTAARTARDLAGWLERTYGVRVEQIQVPPPYEHPHQSQMDALLLSALGFGLMAMVLSAVLVATMVSGLLAQQTRQIGILKAIGARSGGVLGAHLVMVVVVAAIATAIAIAPGILLARAYSSLLLSAMLNMDATGFAVPWWTYAAVVAVGVALPPLVALAPLLRAARTTVRDALEDHGVDPGGASRADAWLGAIRGLDRMLALGLRNVFRRRGRLVLSVGLLAAAGGLFMSGMDAVASVQAVPSSMASEQRWDVDVRLARPVSTSELTGLTARLPNVGRVEPWSVVPSGLQHPGQIAVTRTWPDQGHGSLNVTAVPTGTTELRAPALLEGRWLRPGDVDAVVLNQMTRQSTLPDVRPGDTIGLSIGGRSTSWHVVGIAQELFAGVCPCVTPAGLERATGWSGRANSLRIVTDRHDVATRDAVAQAAERALRGAGIEVTSSRPVDWMTSVADGHMFALASINLVLALVMAVIGLIGLGSTMSANVLERTREFGVMHAIGAGASAVRRIVVAEGVFTALLSCAVAVVLAVLFAAGLAQGIGRVMLDAPLPFRFSPMPVAVWIVAIVVASALATLAAAYRASRLTVREALAHP